MKRLYDRRLHGSTEPWWVEDAGRGEPAPRLEEAVDADVAIVGGGLTGLWTALAVLERTPAARVVVLEASRSGDGASARNGGFLHGYWSSLPRLVDLLGADDALEVARSANGIVAAVRALGEDVWLEEGGLLLVSASGSHDETVRRAVAVAEKLGVPEEAVLVRRDDVPVRSPAFREAVRFRDGATVHPGRLVQAVRSAALRAGARLTSSRQRPPSRTAACARRSARSPRRRSSWQRTHGRRNGVLPRDGSQSRRARSF